MRAFLTITVLVATLGAGPIFAAQAAPQPAKPVSATTTATAEAVGEGDDKIICRRDKALGSRLSAKKVCQTAAEWERQRREDQQLAERVQGGRSKSN